MRVAIVGYGVEGQESAHYWQSLGNEVTICDQNTDLKPDNPAYRLKLGPDHLKGLEEFDLIVRSPGLNPQKIFDANPDHPEIKAKITSALNEFLEKSPSVNIIGVTGTKGKGTTSTLITKLLEAQGKTVHLGGNIGEGFLKILPHVNADDWVVLELSSFQLYDARRSPHVAVCLMVVPEHLDWHHDLNDYTGAKTNLFKHQTTDDIAIYFAKSEDSKKIAANSPGKKTPYFEQPGAYVRDDGKIVIGETEVINKSEVKLLGEHNLQNVCAAVTAVYEALGSLDKAKAVLSSFSGLEHRLELVRTLDGIKYYDDSFGTTPETAVVAIEAFQEPKVVILGGSDKGTSFDDLADAITKNNVKHVLTIGVTGPAIAALLRQRGYAGVTEGLTNMTDMVAEARKIAETGDIVLLSTGCASFGLFKNYKDRGEQFKQAVLALS
jgi:UDP-N-acetylmuramoylalanine--D-glutamate ligase